MKLVNIHSFVFMKGLTSIADCTHFIILNFFPTHHFAQTSTIPFLFMLFHMPKTPPTPLPPRPNVKHEQDARCSGDALTPFIFMFYGLPRWQILLFGLPFHLPCHLLLLHIFICPCAFARPNHSSLRTHALCLL